MTTSVRRQWTAAVLALVAALLLALTPNLARAHDWEASGLGGAQLKVTPSGYDPDEGQGVNFGLDPLPTIEGQKFVPNDVARVFLCEAGESDLLQQCRLMGVTPTAADGSFSVRLNWTNEVIKPDGSRVTCYGNKLSTNIQCSVIAATFSPVSGEPTSKAEHYV